MVGYVYAGMWFLVGLLLIFRMRKENKVFLPVGIFFLILGGWWLANELTPADLFQGVWGWVLRGITAVILVLACVVFAKGMKEGRAAFRENEEQEASGAPDEEKSTDKGEHDGC